MHRIILVAFAAIAVSAVGAENQNLNTQALLGIQGRKDFYLGEARKLIRAGSFTEDAEKYVIGLVTTYVDEAFPREGGNEQSCQLSGSYNESCSGCSDSDPPQWVTCDSCEAGHGWVSGAPGLRLNYRRDCDECSVKNSYGHLECENMTPEAFNRKIKKENFLKDMRWKISNSGSFTGKGALRKFRNIRKEGNMKYWKEKSESKLLKIIEEAEAPIEYFSVCAYAEEDTCYCKGTVYYGLKFVEGKPGAGKMTSFQELYKALHAWQPNFDGNILCANSAFPDPLHGYYKYCWCEWGVNMNKWKEE